MRLNLILLLSAFVTVLFLSSCGGGDGTTPVAPSYPTGKPTGVKVVAGNQSATLSWDPVPGALGYYVYYSEDGVHFVKYSSDMIKTTSFLVLGLVNGRTYYFGVSAAGSGNWETSIAYPGGNPTAVPVVPGEPGPPPTPGEGVPPGSPQNLQGVAKDSAAELEWDPPSDPDLAYYRIYRRDHASGGDFVLHRDQYDTTSFRDTDLTNDLVYSYRITAVDTEGLESDPSNVVTLTPRDFPPEPLQGMAIVVNPGRIILEWNIPQETDIVKYAIERVEGVDPTTHAEILSRILIDKPTQPKENPHEYLEGMIKAYVDIGRGVVNVVDMSVTVGIVYTYRISAIDAAGHEGSPVSITAPFAVY